MSNFFVLQLVSEQWRRLPHPIRGVGVRLPLSRVLVTGTSVDASRRALELATTAGAAGDGGAQWQSAAASADAGARCNLAIVNSVGTGV